MKWDEEKFGLEYDLDIFNVVAVNDFNMGAMENKGLNIFNTAYVLAKPGAAHSPTSVDNFFLIKSNVFPLVTCDRGRQPHSCTGKGLPPSLCFNGRETARYSEPPCLDQLPNYDTPSI